MPSTLDKPRFFEVHLRSRPDVKAFYYLYEDSCGWGTVEKGLERQAQQMTVASTLQDFLKLSVCMSVRRAQRTHLGIRESPSTNSSLSNWVWMTRGIHCPVLAEPELLILSTAQLGHRPRAIPWRRKGVLLYNFLSLLACSFHSRNTTRLHAAKNNVDQVGKPRRRSDRERVVPLDHVPLLHLVERLDRARVPPVLGRN